MRVELYRRRVAAPRPRYENLYEPYNLFPEAEPDRIRLEPESSVARGVEVLLRGRAGTRVTWLGSYAWSRTEDRLEGQDVRRQIDQPHTVTVDVDVQLGKHWRLNAAWRYHTGWPTTALSVVAVPEAPEGTEGPGDEEEPENEDREEPGEDGRVEYVPVLGPLNGERLDDYHRLDLRLSRHWQLRTGTLGFFTDVQNLYDRENMAGFDHEIDDETGELTRIVESWPGFFASIGVSFEF